MRVWNDIPIKQKLTGVILLTNIVSLLLACGAFILYEKRSSPVRMAEELSAQAAMIGANSTAALTFNDKRSAEDTLQALTFGRSVQVAVIYTMDGKQFAGYRDPNAPHVASMPFERNGQRFEGNRLLLWRPIVLAGNTIGTIGLSAGLEAMDQRLLTYVGIASLILIAAMGAALVIASAIQGVISRPILRLAETARRVYTEKNFSLREERSGGDEVGVLVGQFNYMLGQIEDGNEALRRAQEEWKQGSSSEPAN